MNDSRPIRYLSNFSLAHTAPKHSFSICSYLRSGPVNVLEHYATGFMTPSCSWSRTPPILLASELTVVGFVRSKKASVGKFDRFSLIFVNAADCDSPHDHVLSLSNSSVIGRKVVDRFGMYLPRKLIIPSILLSSVTFCGSGMLLIAETFAGSG